MSTDPRPRRRRTGPGRLPADAAARLPERLLDAAQAVFVDQGYARASMEAIARAAGTTRKTLYARHANKAEVLAAVVERLLDRALAAAPAPALRAAVASDAGASLRALLRELAELSAAPGVAGLNRLILAEAAQLPELAKLFIDLHARAVAAVRACLDALQARGDLPTVPVDLDSAAALLLEMACSLPRLRALLSQPLTPRQRGAQVDRAVELFLAACGHRR